jgi:hypothetical protein
MQINNNLQGRISVRMILAAVVTVAAVGLGLQPAKAYTAPWCAVINLGTGNVYWDCRYSSIEQCRPNVLAGNRGFCNPNPYFVAAYQPVERRRHRKH